MHTVLPELVMLSASVPGVEVLRMPPTSPGCCELVCCESDFCRLECCNSGFSNSEYCESGFCKLECCDSGFCRLECCNSGFFNSECCKSGCCGSGCCGSECCASGCCPQTDMVGVCDRGTRVISSSTTELLTILAEGARVTCIRQSELRDKPGSRVISSSILTAGMVTAISLVFPDRVFTCWSLSCEGPM